MKFTMRKVYYTYINTSFEIKWNLWDLSAWMRTINDWNYNFLSKSFFDDFECSVTNSNSQLINQIAEKNKIFATLNFIFIFEFFSIFHICIFIRIFYIIIFSTLFSCILKKFEFLLFSSIRIQCIMSSVH